MRKLILLKGKNIYASVHDAKSVREKDYVNKNIKYYCMNFRPHDSSINTI
jgi:hypothetical protein